MIVLTRLNQQEVMVNAAHIALVEVTPDTVITLLNGERLMVKEAPHEIRTKIMSYLRQVGWVPVVLGTPDRTLASEGN